MNQLKMIENDKNESLKEPIVFDKHPLFFSYNHTATSPIVWFRLHVPFPRKKGYIEIPIEPLQFNYYGNHIEIQIEAKTDYHGGKHGGAICRRLYFDVEINEPNDISQCFSHCTLWCNTFEEQKERHERSKDYISVFSPTKRQRKRKVAEFAATKTWSDVSVSDFIVGFYLDV